MFEITKESVHEIMIKALHEITRNPIHFKWLLEYNLALAFSSHVSFIVAREYNTVLDVADFNYLLRRVCESYIKFMSDKL